MDKNYNINYFNPKQAFLPILISDYLDICDPVLTFDRFMGEIELEKYLKNIPKHYTGEIFNDINYKILKEELVDLQHLYIDGSKFEANANKLEEYTENRKKYMSLKTAPYALMQSNAKKQTRIVQSESIRNSH